MIKQVPESEAKIPMMVVVDRFTKMAHFIALHENASSRDFGDTFLVEGWKLPGL